MKASEATLALYLLENQNIDSSLSEQVKIQEAAYKQEEELLRQKHSKGKLLDEGYTLESLIIKKKHTQKLVEASIAQARKELELYELQNQSKLEQGQAFTQELLDQEQQRIQRLHEKKLELLQQEREAKLISDQDFEIQKLKLHQEREKAKLDLSKQYKKEEQSQWQNQFELRRLQGEHEFDLRLEELERKKEEVAAAKAIGADVRAVEDKYAQMAAQIEQAKQQARLSIAAGAAGQLADLLGKETAAGKAAAIAKTMINTYQAAMAFYGSAARIPFLGWKIGPITSAIAIATGLSAVKKIASTDVSRAQGKAQSFGASAQKAHASLAYKNPARAARGALIILKGPSHAAGGINLYDQQGRPVVNAEGDEKVVINKRASQLLESLGFLNQAAGSIPLSRSLTQAAAEGIISREAKNQPPPMVNFDTRTLKEPFKEALKESFQGEGLREALREGFDQTKVVLLADQASRVIGKNVEFKTLGNL